MPLVPCRECANEVSESARFCPLCGAPHPARPEWKGTGVDWKSEATLWGVPLVHVACGRDAKGKLRVAKGIIAIGQFGIGLVTIAQFGVGLFFGFGQFVLGTAVVAQVAVGVVFGLGQVAVGYCAIGQVVVGVYALGQAGIAEYLWSTQRKDPEAVEFFGQMVESVRQLLGR